MFASNVDDAEFSCDIYEGSCLHHWRMNGSICDDVTVGPFSGSKFSEKQISEKFHILGNKSGYQN